MLTDMVTYLTGLVAGNAVVSAWGAALVLNTNLFVHKVPDSPNDLIVLTPYGGPPPDTERKVMNMNLQIRLRSKTPAKAYNTGVELIKALHVNGTITDGVTFAINSSPLPLGLDEKGRFTYTVNFRIKYIYE